MKLDYFIYSRGVEREDGFKLRHGPEYINMEVVNGCQAFFNCVRRKGSVTDDAYECNNSYIFMPLKDYNCCLLMRSVMIENYDTLEYVFDFQNRQTWSLEGICCPYSQARYFFALLPSILIFMKMNERHSLHTLMSSGRLGDRIELPDEMIYNPVSGAQPGDVPAFRDIMGDKDETVFASAVNDLVNMIHNTDEPFSFTFGTLAKPLFDELGRGYELEKCISTLKDHFRYENLPDNFQFNEIKIRADETPAASGKKTEYILKLTIRPDYKKGGYYFWSIGDRNNKSVDDVLTSDQIPFDMDIGLSVSRLLAEANCIRDIASNLGWEVQPFTNDSMSFAGNYVFIKRE